MRISIWNRTEKGRETVRLSSSLGWSETNTSSLMPFGSSSLRVLIKVRRSTSILNHAVFTAKKSIEHSRYGMVWYGMVGMVYGM